MNKATLTVTGELLANEGQAGVRRAVEAALEHAGEPAVVIVLRDARSLDQATVDVYTGFDEVKTPAFAVTRLLTAALR